MSKKPKMLGNKYAALSEPQASFDFHGRGVLSKDQIVEFTRMFVQDCSQKGYKKILIITGKGLHSRSGPVVGPLVQDILLELPQVRSVETARRDRGGEGALEVQLRA